MGSWTMSQMAEHNGFMAVLDLEDFYSSVFKYFDSSAILFTLIAIKKRSTAWQYWRLIRNGEEKSSLQIRFRAPCACEFVC